MNKTLTELTKNSSIIAMKLTTWWNTVVVKVLFMCYFSVDFFSQTQTTDSCIKLDNYQREKTGAPFYKTKK